MTITTTLTCLACNGAGQITTVNTETGYVGPIRCRPCNGTGQRAGDGKPLFKLGRTTVTPGAIAAQAHALQWLELLNRHVRGDWGDAGHGDAVANEAALFDGEMILSVYQVGPERIWIMTAADRSETTVMLPYEFAKKEKENDNR